MTDAELKELFSKIRTYPELFATAVKLKNQGVPEVKVNKFMSKRKNELVKASKNIPSIKCVEMLFNETKPEPQLYTNIQVLDPNGSVIDFTGKAIVFR